jgi:5-methylcytosine-specific restriction endonuclease McrA
VSDWREDAWEEEPNWQQCTCEEGTPYNASKYRSCYSCYLDRRADFLTCIYCGRWHSPDFATCYECRSIKGRDETGSDLRLMILTRDGFRCWECGSTDRLQVDHVIPCAKGGNARPWNLLTRCLVCNQRKGAIWFPGCRWEIDRDMLLRAYVTYLRAYLTTEERVALQAEVDEWRRQGLLDKRRRLAALGPPWRPHAERRPT